MDPLSDLQVPDDQIRAVDPLARAKARMEAGERQEAQRAELAVEQRVERAQALAAEREYLDRMELAGQGHLSREVAAVHAEAMARRQGRILELRTELDKLTGQSEQGWRPPTADDVEAQLQAHRAEAAAWNGPQMRRIRAAALTDELSRSQGRTPARRAAAPDWAGDGPGWAPEITRTTPPLGHPGAPYPSEDTPYGRRPGGPVVPLVDA